MNMFAPRLCALVMKIELKLGLSFDFLDELKYVLVLDELKHVLVI